MKAIVWGAGGTAKEFFQRKLMSSSYEIVCVIDSNPSLWGSQICGYNIVAPAKIKEFDFDVLIVCSLYYTEIIASLENELGIEKAKIKTYQDLDREICKEIVKKYECCDDPDMKATVEAFRSGKSSFFGAYNPEYKRFDEVFRDEEGWPYILFQDKRMYYPYDYGFMKRDGKEVVPDILYEQAEDSPHKYFPKGYELPKDAVIIDAGVCEGNFALRYIDEASLIYLIEADARWSEALARTFSPYKDKIVLINKFLSGRDNSHEIRLDSLVEGRVDFLKMDIEGAELEALLGAERVLRNSTAQCAICSYHRQYDEEYIKRILNSYGYTTSTSKGYVYFPYDEFMKDTLDLRRGVVYGSKKE